MSFVERAIVLEPGEGRVSPLLVGSRVTHKLAAANTRGNFGLAELTLDGEGPAPHIHHGEDETFYVLEGEVNFRVGDRAIFATKGTLVFAPKDVPHAFSSAGPDPAKMICIFSPGGLEQIFLDVMAPPTPKTKQEFATKAVALAGKYNLEILPPKAG